MLAGASEFAPGGRLDFEAHAFLDDDDDILGRADLDDGAGLAREIEIEVCQLVRRARQAAGDARLRRVARIQRADRAQRRGRDIADRVLDRLRDSGDGARDKGAGQRRAGTGDDLAGEALLAVGIDEEALDRLVDHRMAVEVYAGDRDELDLDPFLGEAARCIADNEATGEIGLDLVGENSRCLDPGYDRFGITGRVPARQSVYAGQEPSLHETRWQIDRPLPFF